VFLAECYAKIALQKAGNIENQHNKNVAKLEIELSEKPCHMADLEWYKEPCEKKDNIMYYNSFQKYERKDIDTYFCRVKLDGFWDEIIEKWEKDELPSDFQSQNKGINVGISYRRLVKPMDIADYYRMPKGEGSYLSDGRPKQIIYIRR